MYQDLLKNDLDTLLQSGLISGKNPRVLAADIKKKFDVKTSDAERLMRTELARVQTEAQKQSFERNGFSMYTFIVNSGCCPICEGIAKENGGHYKVADMMPGLNAPPLHPFVVALLRLMKIRKNTKNGLII
jgi:SPP1 gp7 family putative phage head morphogenesis protein